MELKKLLDDYEIGGIGDIKKHTLRFHSYRIGTEDGKLTIFAEYTPGQFPPLPPDWWTWNPLQHTSLRLRIFKRHLRQPFMTKKLLLRL